jgi:hypothetical protein
MSTRGAGRASRRGRLATLAALGLVAATSLAACGTKNFANDPRPTAAIDVGARIDAKRVAVSPAKFGAGLVRFTVLNLSSSPVRFEISGPKHGSTDEIPPDTPGSLQVNLAQGHYRATAGRGSSARPATITVGPERHSSQNQVLLP